MLHVEEHGSAPCLHRDSTPNVDQGSELPPGRQAEQSSDDLAYVLKEALALAVQAEQWGLVAALAKQLEGPTTEVMVVLRGGKRAALR